MHESVGFADTLSVLNDWRSLLLLHFRLFFSRSGRFCGNPLPSFGVSPVPGVASLWVLVLQLHTSLSACNRDMPLIHSSAWTVERRHSQPHGEVLSVQSFHGDFHARLPRRIVSCLEIIPCSNIEVSQFIHITSSVAFLLRRVVKTTKLYKATIPVNTWNRKTL